MFIGRKAELKIIQEAIHSTRAELGIIYGRRRVGKSSLLEKAAEGTPSLFFEGLEKGDESTQIEHFVNQLAEQTRTMPVRALSWKDAFDALTLHLTKGKHYVVFDELPWMASGRPALIALLKFYWDRNWKKNPHTTLVLCGSIANFMVKHVVHSSALHNRKTFELKIDPLPAREAKAFFKGYRSDFEIAKFLMIFGGVPKYLEQINPKESLAQNMNRLCFRKTGFFMNEFETLFKEQFKVTRTYEAIVELLSRKSSSREEIAKMLRMKSGGGISRYIEQLQRADFTQSFMSLSLDRKAGQKTKKYALWDEWLRFFFTYMKPNLAAIQTQQNGSLFDSLTSSSFATYFGYAFERLCFKNIDQIIHHLDIEPHQILGYGPFFRQHARKQKNKRKTQEGFQIDLLIHRRGQVLTLVECKFSEHPIGMSVIDEVERKIALLAAPKKFTIERVLITANGVTPQVKREGYFHRIIGLEAIFGN